jgi:hypothetical protein
MADTVPDSECFETPGIVYKDANVTVTAFPVKHGDGEASGYRVETLDRTIVISGDTTPTQSIIDNCNGCDVLIHKADSMMTPSASDSGESGRTEETTHFSYEPRKSQIKRTPAFPVTPPCVRVRTRRFAKVGSTHVPVKVFRLYVNRKHKLLVLYHRSNLGGRGGPNLDRNIGRRN